jgi:uncharacterized membrane protein
MVNWFIASLNVLLWGLSLMVLWRTLTITPTIPAQGRARLVRIGSGIAIAGALIIAIGTWIWGQRPQDGIAITSIGGAVIALSATTIFGALGHRHRNEIRLAAWSVTGIGAVAFIVGLIVYFTCPLLRAW